jgi:hypothetical protein
MEVSSKRERDADMDRLLRGALRADGPPAGDCPIAADLAAFVERALSRLEREQIEGHLAHCPLCQQALAAMADLPARPMATPGGAAGSVAPWKRWLTPGRLRWLVPVSAAATTLVVYLAMQPAPPQVSSPDRPTTPAGAAPASAEPGAAPPPSGPAQPELTARRAERVPPPSPKASRDLPRDTRTPAGRWGAGLAVDFPSDTRSRAVGAVPPLPVEGQAKKAQAPERPRVTLDSVSVTAESQAVPPLQAKGISAPVATPQARAVTAPGVAGAIVESVVVTKPGPVMTNPIFSPDGSTRWRVEGGGRIFRSTDGGMTWQPQPSGTTADLLAGAAPTPTACWAVGRGGAVLLAPDGEHWQPRPFPERVDLVRVEAVDARHATVTARDGRRFTTTDGGVTWSIAR